MAIVGEKRKKVRCDGLIRPPFLKMARRTRCCPRTLRGVAVVLNRRKLLLWVVMDDNDATVKVKGVTTHEWSGPSCYLVVWMVFIA